MTEPYHTDNNVTLHHGDCLAHLRDMPDNSVDSIVTDPPYGLSNTTPDKVADTIVRWASGERDHVPEGRGFMGRSWDAFVPPPAVWDECLRVLKPGGHMLVFAGSRTQDLMGLSIRLAGFEIRDSLAWIYGCLSEDSEALTRRGWVKGPDLLDTDQVLQWDHETGQLSWTTPQRIIVKPWAGHMVRLANRHTDQLVTPDHRVYAQVRRHSRNPAPDAYEVVEAQDLRPSWQVTLPMAGTLDGGDDVDPDLAYLVGWWLTDAWRHGDGKAVMFSQSKPETLEKLRTALEPHAPSEYIKTPRCDRHSPEHTFYVTGDLAARLIEGWPDRELGWDVLGWSLEARTRLLDGLVDGDGSRKGGQHGVAFWSKKQDRLDIVTALFLSVGWRAYADPAKGVVYANPSPTTQVQKRHRDAAPGVEYEGLVWCVTVPTGAFVARRNNRPFITGNSGFPKSLDVSKAIDKAAGAGRGDVRHVGFSMFGEGVPRCGECGKSRGSQLGNCRCGDIKSAPVTPDAARWSGWGTSLKPAHEPILCARKPLGGAIDVTAFVERELRAAGVTGDIKWTTSNASAVAKSSPTPTSGSTEPQRMAGTSAKTASDSETQPTAKPTETPTAKPADDGQPTTLTGNVKHASGTHGNSATKSVQPTGRTASAAANPKTPSSPSTTSKEGGPRTARNSTARSTSTSDAKGSPPVTESFAGIATGLTGSQAHVRISRNQDGSFTWPDGLPQRVAVGSTVAGNVLEWGTGALNIDASRVEGEANRPMPRAPQGGILRLDGCHTEAELRALAEAGGKTPSGRDARATLARAIADRERYKSSGEKVTNAGRWPANVLLDPEAAEAMDEQSGVTGSNFSKRKNARKTEGVYGEYAGDEPTRTGPSDTGGASRFFPVFKYQAKAPKRERPVIEREDGSKIQHPTVKPLALMEWLVTLITPPGGTVLDPFAGSGTTLQAARDKGFRSIGVEADVDHCELIVARLSKDDGGLFAA